MSILDQLQLPKVVRKEIRQEDVKSSAPASEEKPFLLCLTRDLSPEELQLIQSYGKVFIFHESFRNIPLSSHDFSYAVFDLREKVHRDSLMKEDLTAYHIIAVVGLLDRHDDTHSDVGAENLIHSFPLRQAFKLDFDRLLLSSKIRKPSLVKSLFRFFCFLSDGLSSK